MDGDEEQQQKQLEELNTRYARQKEKYKGMPGPTEGKYLSNKTHYSPVDPDARIAVKSGKPRLLYYNGQLAVDTNRHVITHVEATHADGRDGKDLQQVVNSTKQLLQQEGLVIENILADAGYSNGENYRFLEEQNLMGYIPLLVGALKGHDDFIYNNDHYLCPNNKILKGSGRVVDDGKGHPVRKYYSLKSDCDQCPFKLQCIGATAKQKKVQHSIYRE